MKLNPIAIALALCLPSVIPIGSSATVYTNNIRTDNVTLSDGDSIVIDSSVSNPTALFVDPGVPVDIGSNGSIMVSVDTDRPDVRGINIQNAKGNNLGTGTDITVKSSSNTGSAIALNMAGNSSVSANGLNINVIGTNTAIGVNLAGQSNIIEFGNGSVISSTSTNGNSSGLYAGSGSNEINANALTVSASGTNVNGINVNGLNTINLGSNTKIDVIGSKSGAALNVYGSGQALITANSITTTSAGDNVVGVKLSNASDLSAVNFGDDSKIITSGNNSSGVLLTESNKAVFNADSLSVKVSGANSNAIEVHNGTVNIGKNSVLLSEKHGGVAAISDREGDDYEPIINVDGSYIEGEAFSALSRGDNSYVNLNNTTLVANSGDAVIANDAGSINLTGINTIHSRNGNAISATGMGSNVTATGELHVYGNVIAENEGSVDLKLIDGSMLLGKANVDDKSTINMSLSSDSIWHSTGSSIISNLDLDNSSVIFGRESDKATVITVEGNYSSNNGHLFFNTQLDGDNSDTDRLIIKGDTNGESLVYVNNMGGMGSQTINGIELISVYGMSDGHFSQSGRIVAGAYDYFLLRGKTEGTYGNWYLRSELPVEPPVPPVEPPVPPVEPPVPPVEPPVPPVEPPVSPPMITRPEAGSYVDNLMATQTMFSHRLHDRLGETQYIDALTGQKYVSSLWLRQVGGHNNWRSSDGQLKTQSNRYVVQLGGDIAQWSNDGLDRFHLGIMAGYGNHSSSTHSSVTQYKSKGSVNGYSVGGYATWYANDIDKQGLYIDGWTQYNWFKNTVSGEDISGEKYNSKGLSASLESGYTFKASDFTGSLGTKTNWFIQPQAQIIWSGVKSDRHIEENGTKVNSSSNDIITTRMGVRTFLQGHNKIDDNKDRTFEPFVELNWFHTNKNYSVRMDDGVISQSGAKDLGEIKVGVEGQVSKKLNVWGNIGSQLGKNGYNDSALVLGIKYNF